MKEELDQLLSALDSCKSLAMELQSRSAAVDERQAGLDYYLEYLLEGNYLSEEVIRRHVADSGWEQNEYTYLLCVNAYDGGGDVDVGRYAPLLMAGDLLLRFHDHVVAIFSRKKPVESELLVQGECHLAEQELRAGMSLPLESLNDLRSGYNQATAALEIGARVDRERHLYLYGDYITYDLIHCFGRRNDLSRFLTPELKRLIQVDQEQDLELLKTLRVYFRDGRSVQQAAQELHVHRNTVTYRIGKAFEILGHELNDGRYLLQLGMEIQILEYMDRTLYFG